MIVRGLLVVALALAGALPVEAARRRPLHRPEAAPRTVAVHDDFRFGPLGWEGGFADYSPDNMYMMLLAEIRPLPPEIAASGTGFYIQGQNSSDDLFMFLMKRLTAADGVHPGRSYEASFRIVFDSNAGGDQCGGIGGAPGFSVFLKAGATGTQPRIALDELNTYRLNIDIGNQAVGGRDASVVSTIENGTPICSGDAPFVRLVRTHTHPHPVTASPFGEIWLLVGTDSGFEGLTKLYYESIEVTLTPIEDGGASSRHAIPSE